MQRQITPFAPPSVRALFPEPSSDKKRKEAPKEEAPTQEEAHAAAKRVCVLEAGAKACKARKQLVKENRQVDADLVAICDRLAEAAALRDVGK